MWDGVRAGLRASALRSLFSGKRKREESEERGRPWKRICRGVVEPAASAGAEEWRRKAKKEQEAVGRWFPGDQWERYSTKERAHLELKVGYAMYGAPPVDPPPPCSCPTPADCDCKDYVCDFLLCKEDLGYGAVKYKTLSDIVRVLFKASETEGEVGVSFIFLFFRSKDGKTETRLPLFRVLAKGGVTNFVDSEGRVYKNWKDFEKSNRLPKGVYCHPAEGVYGSGCSVGFAATPASTLRRALLKGVDVVGAVTCVGATGVGLVALAVPVAAPLLLGAAITGGLTTVWSAGRSVETLVDRGVHDQTVSPTDAEARGAWLGVAAAAAGAAAGGAVATTALAARSGRLLGPVTRIVVKGATGTAVAVGGVGLVDRVVTVTWIKKGSVTFDDLLDLGIALFFFVGSVVTFRAVSKHLAAVPEGLTTLEMVETVHTGNGTLWSCLGDLPLMEMMQIGRACGVPEWEDRFETVFQCWTAVKSNRRNAAGAVGELVAVVARRLHPHQLDLIHAKFVAVLHEVARWLGLDGKATMRVLSLVKTAALIAFRLSKMREVKFADLLSALLNLHREAILLVDDLKAAKDPDPIGTAERQVEKLARQEVDRMEAFDAPPDRLEYTVYPAEVGTERAPLPRVSASDWIPVLAGDLFLEPPTPADLRPVEGAPGRFAFLDPEKFGAEEIVFRECGQSDSGPPVYRVSVGRKAFSRPLAPPPRLTHKNAD